MKYRIGQLLIELQAAAQAVGDKTLGISLLDLLHKAFAQTEG